MQDIPHYKFKFSCPDLWDYRVCHVSVSVCVSRYQTNEKRKKDHIYLSHSVFPAGDCITLFDRSTLFPRPPNDNGHDDDDDVTDNSFGIAILF